MAKKHVHKYRRVEVNGVKVFACALPDCSHHMPKHYENLLIGKNSICHKCGDTMKLDMENMKYDFPWCPNCKYGDITGENEPAVFECKTETEQPEPKQTQVITVDKNMLDNLFRK